MPATVGYHGLPNDHRRVRTPLWLQTQVIPFPNGLSRRASAAMVAGMIHIIFASCVFSRSLAPLLREVSDAATCDRRAID